jgi:hypothetical protein
MVRTWETLAQRRKIALLCVLVKVYTGGRSWKDIGGRLQRLCYLSRVDHDIKITSRMQRADSQIKIDLFPFRNRPEGLIRNIRKQYYYVTTSNLNNFQQMQFYFCQHSLYHRPTNKVASYCITSFLLSFSPFWTSYQAFMQKLQGDCIVAWQHLIHKASSIRGH